MTQVEVKEMLLVVTRFYPKYYKDFTEFDFQGLTVSWAMALEGFTKEEASKGLMAYFKSDRKGIPPVPGQVIDMIYKATDPAEDENDALKAWVEVREAIRDSTYHAEERFKELPELCKQIVAAPANLRAWGQLPSEEVTSMVQARFIHAYNDAKQQRRELRRIGIRETKQIEKNRNPQLAGE